MSRYHRKVYFEPGATDSILDQLEKFGQFRPTAHCQLRSDFENVKTMPPISAENIYEDDIIEYTKENGKIIKALVRIPDLSEKLDFIYSISMAGEIITCFVNDKTDAHNTLNRQLYQKA